MFDISYCGIYTEELPTVATQKCIDGTTAQRPQRSEDRKSGLLERNGGTYLLTDGRLFQFKNGQPVDLCQPKKFFFFDVCGKQILQVNKRKVKQVDLNGRVLNCTDRKIYDVKDGCRKPVCDLSDTKSISRITLVSAGQSTVTIKLLSRCIEISEFSEFGEDEVQIAGDTATLTLTDQSRVFIYKFEDCDKIKVCECDKIIQTSCNCQPVLVNHIILVLPSVPIPPCESITQTYTPGIYTFIAPCAGTLMATAQGGGGGGGGGGFGGIGGEGGGGGGGGGGATASNSISVNTDDVFTIIVGEGGTFGTGATSTDFSGQQGENGDDSNVTKTNPMLPSMVIVSVGGGMGGIGGGIFGISGPGGLGGMVITGMGMNGDPGNDGMGQIGGMGGLPNGGAGGDGGGSNENGDDGIAGGDGFVTIVFTPN